MQNQQSRESPDYFGYFVPVFGQNGKKIAHCFPNTQRIFMHKYLVFVSAQQTITTVFIVMHCSFFTLSSKDFMCLCSRLFGKIQHAWNRLASKRNELEFLRFLIWKFIQYLRNKENILCFFFFCFFFCFSCACLMRSPSQGTKPYQAHYLSVCCVFCAHVQFCQFDKADAIAAVQ